MVQIGAVDKDSKYAKKQHQNLVSVANEIYLCIQEQLADDMIQIYFTRFNKFNVYEKV